MLISCSSHEFLFHSGSAQPNLAAVNMQLHCPGVKASNVLGIHENVVLPQEFFEHGEVSRTDCESIISCVLDIGSAGNFKSQAFFFCSSLVQPAEKGRNTGIHKHIGVSFGFIGIYARKRHHDVQKSANFSDGIMQRNTETTSQSMRDDNVIRLGNNLHLSYANNMFQSLISLSREG